MCAYTCDQCLLTTVLVALASAARQRSSPASSPCWHSSSSLGKRIADIHPPPLAFARLYGSGIGHSLVVCVFRPPPQPAAKTATVPHTTPWMATNAGAATAVLGVWRREARGSEVQEEELRMCVPEWCQAASRSSTFGCAADQPHFLPASPPHNSHVHPSRCAVRGSTVVAQSQPGPGRWCC